MQTGENEHGLRRIIDFTRLLSLLILVIHFYLTCYAAFQGWHLTAQLADHIIESFIKMSVFKNGTTTKTISLALLAVSLVGTRGRKEEKIKLSNAVAYIGLGLLLFFGSWLLLMLRGTVTFRAVIYISVTGLGYVLMLTGGTLISRLLKFKFKQDVFNKVNETFPQEERLLENEYSINLPARYSLKGKIRKSWINIINPFRGTEVLGTPGAGKTYFVIRHVISQHIRKGFSMFIYDFKYPDLTRIAYNTLLNHPKGYQIRPQFYVINFDDLSRSHRCNPLDPSTMEDITDAMEAARTIMMGLNREWIRKQGDFFVESPIIYVTAMIWYLKKYKGGKYCTLPHVVELMQVEYAKLFAVLKKEREIDALINPFISAYENDAMDQLEGQISGAGIAMAKLASPQLYYILSGNDFTLDLNNPQEPKLISLGNNPQKQQVYGAVLSLYITKMIKLVNKPGQLKSSLIFDEFPTIYFNGIDTLMATARSNKVATTLAVQDYSQLKRDYGKEQADVVMNLPGNIISGQVAGETAKALSESFGRIIQDRQSTSINSSDTSVNYSGQLDAAIPLSTIASLSSGEFVGIVADNPDQKITLKAFHVEIVNDHEAIQKEEAKYRDLPVLRSVTHDMVWANYLRIKMNIEGLILEELKLA
ncbi:conjugal transfer protein MobC [Mucilaginibacter ginsenosidivorans]|uniref:Conjugal transfer protein TraG n=1 Tax=Mucilaginibacter ginsenosidivorans TaxID=398053 RepID=A0A5B8UTS7_9SPHI|nr:conjugal transfer protein MobC [Mucilaginibacter ginsenosidivorans]QEC62424.1 conjugal transfer protein TraG [Mucilaginibacter ginsenosidivorans]